MRLAAGYTLGPRWPIGESNIEKIKSGLISEASDIVKTEEDTIEDSITVSNIPAGKKSLKCSWCNIL